MRHGECEAMRQAYLISPGLGLAPLQQHLLHVVGVGDDECRTPAYFLPRGSAQSTSIITSFITRHIHVYMNLLAL